MSGKDDIFLAVLAMDAYDRGEGRSLKIVQNAAIGEATFKGQLTDAPTSFSATAYNWVRGNNTTTVISYRDTDELGWAADEDVFNGWLVGAGRTLNNQAGQAIAAYQQFTGGHGVYDQTAVNVVLTGHSLGGGLAGYISALSGKPATIFDSMPYGVAVLTTYVTELLTRIASSDPASAVFNLMAKPSLNGWTICLPRS